MFKIGILGKRRDIIFFKTLGFEIFPTEEKDINEILSSLDQDNKFAVICVTSDLVPKIKKEIFDHFQKKFLPTIVSLPLKEEKGETREIKEIIKKAIGREEIVI